MVGVPALRPETFSRSFPKNHRAQTRKTEAIKHKMIEDCAPRMAEAMGWTVDEAASLLGAVLPTLRRWA